jgi:hypothetical protein
MGADKNSSRKRCLPQQVKHGMAKSLLRLNYPVDQDHVATGVLLVLGTNTHQSLLEKQRNKQLEQLTDHTG